MEQCNHYEYYVGRAEACLKMARRSATPSIAAIHRDMATMYQTTAAILATGPERTGDYALRFPTQRSDARAGVASSDGPSDL